MRRNVSSYFYCTGMPGFGIPWPLAELQVHKKLCPPIFGVKAELHCSLVPLQ